MEKTLRELVDEEISQYENKPNNVQDEEKCEELLKEHYERLFYNLNFDNRAILVQLKSCHDQMLSKKQKEAFLKGFSLALTYMQKNYK